MDEFRIVTKLWPSGTELNLGADSNLLGGPYNPTRQAAKFVTDGAQNYQFLFWNTGRHITSKRNVKWIFTVLGWGVWPATKWYGIPGPGHLKKIRVDAFSIGGDASVGSATPIDDPPASTFPPNAWPDSGDDHVVSTANDKVSIAAKDPLNDYDFAGWLQLLWGGDDTGEFVEKDAGSGGSIGGTGFYDHVVGQKYEGAKDSSAQLLAAYGYHQDIDTRRLRDRFYEVLFNNKVHMPDLIADPSPMDRIRMQFLKELVEQTRPGSGGGTDFQRLVATAPNMSRDELKRAVLSLKMTLELGKTALSTIEAQLKGK